MYIKNNEDILRKYIESAFQRRNRSSKDMPMQVSLQRSLAVSVSSIYEHRNDLRHPRHKVRKISLMLYIYK